MYENGLGVEQSDTLAARWYRKAADQGHASAQNSLGGMYIRGRGVAQSDKLAAQWYRKSADQGYRYVQYSLGVMYEEGRGVPASPTEAARLYVEGLKLGDDWAVERDVSDWDRATARAMQEHLKRLGLYDGPIDGQIGPGSRDAMRALLPD
ncbi:SEL1-like repeat protein [Mameliella alba]|uniref:SEL1-like repeat protein n=1 Tax=Mameliella alba TaxID=561184 RepID=UPI000B52A5E5|nr:SEL1-like repeat protein [Mameliella alba]MBY6120013.1 SEL1-like repeat protein [Mameliella alba]OWV45896.1 hypothetical protein CDZ95_02800 [Mameliella alba]OWV64479.1 hypothetical protein CDZ97_11445 [Mameliella alba]